MDLAFRSSPGHPPRSKEPLVSNRGLMGVYEAEQHDSPSSSLIVAAIRFLRPGLVDPGASPSDSSPEVPNFRILLGSSPLPTATEIVVVSTPSSGDVPLPSHKGDRPTYFRLRADVQQSASSIPPMTKLSIQATIGEAVIDAVDFGYYKNDNEGS